MLFISRLVLIFFLLNISLIKLQAKEVRCSSYNLSNLRPNAIDIKIEDYRKWELNNLRILTNETHFIPSKLKKKYDSEINLIYNENISCSLKAKIRIHGDLKDHIIYSNGKIFQSLDVSLEDGHIENITKFKLFLENTRGNYQEEIFMTEFLREIGYLSPRTFRIPVKVNGEKMFMLFQEKFTKEFLEFHQRREGPILEADEKYMFEFASKVKNNPNINWPEIFKQFKLGQKIQLSRLSNSNWSIKNEIFLKNSYNALSNLNLIFLEYLFKMSMSKNNYSGLSVGLNNILLSQNKQNFEQKINIYDLLLLAANGEHALYVNNRKFYWNSFDEYFEPIYYDGDFNFKKKIQNSSLLYQQNYKNTFMDVKNILKNFDKKSFFKSLMIKNSYIKIKEAEFYFQRLSENIDLLSTMYFEKNLSVENKNFKFENFFQTYLKNLNDQNINIKLVNVKEKNINQNLQFQVCDIINYKCEDEQNLNIIDHQKLLESRLKYNNFDYQFLNYESNISKIYKKIFLNDDNFENVTFYISLDSDYKYEENEKIFEIYQLNPNSRAFFKDGKINKVKIKYTGAKQMQNSIINRHDHKTLTGCLSFVNIFFDETTLDAETSNCEDTINIISSNGNIDEITINNALFDGLDIDYSELKIKKAYIKDSLNDCVDFSAGNYSIQNFILNNCGDKGISVGEKSKINMKNINIDNSLIGIASKDSSLSEINNVDITNSQICLSAYKKKQEYDGALIKGINLNCKKFDFKFNVDQFSKILIE